MNKRRIENMIIKAMEILNQDRNEIVNSGKIPSEYNGYIASFGPTVIQSGLVQTLTFYCRNDGKAKDRRKILNLICNTLVNAEYLDNDEIEKVSKLSAYVRSKDETERISLKSLILECAAACKLAMRTFPKEEPKGN